MLRLPLETLTVGTVILDLFTLYIVVLLRGATLSLLWFAIWRHYSDMRVAKTWMLANLVGMIGGGVMALETRAGPLSPAIFGNALVIFASCMLWIGACRFYGRPKPWAASIALTLACTVTLIVFEDHRVVRNLVYLIGQTLPLTFIMVLMAPGRHTPGAMLTMVSMLLATLAMLTRFVGLSAHHVGILPTEIYNVVLFCTMLVTIFGGFVWNFGFLLLAIDRLHTDASALAVVDELTGLANRRMFLTRIEAEKKLCERTGRTFALMAIDLDRFKSINDEYGHAAGDACLAHFSALTNARLRQHDLLARMGGDEFSLLLPDTDAAHATKLAGELVELFRTSPLWWYEISIPLTLSVGVAVWSGAPDAEVSQLMEEADRALYLAKRRGRNCFAVAENDADEVPPLGPLTLAPRS